MKGAFFSKKSIIKFVKLTFIFCCPWDKLYIEVFCVSVSLSNFVWHQFKVWQGPKLPLIFKFWTNPKFDLNVLKTHDVASLMIIYCIFNKKIQKLLPNLLKMAIENWQKFPCKLSHGKWKIIRCHLPSLEGLH